MMKAARKRIRALMADEEKVDKERKVSLMEFLPLPIIIESLAFISPRHVAQYYSINRALNTALKIFRTRRRLLTYKFPLYNFLISSAPIIQTRECFMRLRDYSIVGCVKLNTCSTYSDSMLFSSDRSGDGHCQFRLMMTRDRHVSLYVSGCDAHPPDSRYQQIKNREGKNFGLDGNGYVSPILTQTPLIIDQWHHIAITRQFRDSGFIYSLYLDGSLQSEQISRSGSSLNDHNKPNLQFRLGSRYPPSDHRNDLVAHQPFNGELNNWEYCHFALSAETITGEANLRLEHQAE